MNDLNKFFDKKPFASDQLTTDHSQRTVRVVSVPLDEISFFSLNPRRADNPEYENIKESIRAIGLENPLTITKRPGEPGYTLYNGGNTRLKALKELYKETGDEKYNYQDCRLIEYKSDSELLIRHMIENETRGDMLLIDKAVAAQQIKQLYEQEHNVTLSTRKLADLLSDQGWRVQHKTASLFIFVAEHLANRIPKALNAGMGRPKIELIRKKYHAIKKYIDGRLFSLDIDSADAQNYYLDALGYHDDQDFEESYASDEVCEYISKLTNIDTPRVRFEINHIFEHGEVYSDPSALSDVNDLGQYINNEAEGESTHEPTISNTKSDSEPKEINESSVSNDKEDSSLMPSSAENETDTHHNNISEYDRALNIYRGHISYMRMHYSLMARYMKESIYQPYFELETDAVDEMIITAKRLSPAITSMNATVEELTDAVQIVCLSNYLAAFFQAKIIALQAEPDRQIYWESLLQNINNIDRDLITGIYCYLYGFYVEANNPVPGVFSDFQKLAQYAFNMNNLAQDGGS